MKNEIKAVEELGESIGYGHLMELASAIWRKKMKDAGQPTSGVFVPTLPGFYAEKHSTVAQHYDILINQ